MALPIDSLVAALKTRISQRPAPPLRITKEQFDVREGVLNAKYETVRRVLATEYSGAIAELLTQISSRDGVGAIMARVSDPSLCNFVRRLVAILTCKQDNINMVDSSIEYCELAY